ncbi:hypothetical protein V8C35DRAFT_281377 [Trichoderma chlorosporum]
MAQVESLESLKVVPNYFKVDDLAHAQFFRYKNESVEGPFVTVVEVACLKDCYFVWRMIIDKMRQPVWPKAVVGLPSLSDTDMNDMFVMIFDELPKYQSDHAAIGSERITIFEHYEKPYERMAWCVKRCDGKPWFEIKNESGTTN